LLLLEGSPTNGSWVGCDDADVDVDADVDADAPLSDIVEINLISSALLLDLHLVIPFFSHNSSSSFFDSLVDTSIFNIRDRD
jgi:hypothetical protein